MLHYLDFVLFLSQLAVKLVELGQQIILLIGVAKLFLPARFVKLVSLSQSLHFAVMSALESIHFFPESSQMNLIRGCLLLDKLLSAYLILVFDDLDLFLHLSVHYFYLRVALFPDLVWIFVVDQPQFHLELSNFILLLYADLFDLVKLLGTSIVSWPLLLQF